MNAQTKPNSTVEHTLALLSAVRQYLAKAPNTNKTGKRGKTIYALYYQLVAEYQYRQYLEQRIKELEETHTRAQSSG